jgi:hypothetical protein
MIDIPTLTELREVRRRLAEACGHDIDAYAAMLAQTERPAGMRVISKPFTYESDSAPALIEPSTDTTLASDRSPVP